MSVETGKTRHTGYQFGIRRTINLSVAEVWDFLFSKHGLAIWLGDVKTTWEQGATYQTHEGVSGEIRVFKPHSHIRLTWKPPKWVNTSLLQIRTIPNRDKTVLSFHQEKLAGSKQRASMEEHWHGVMEEIICTLTAAKGLK